MAEVDNKFFRIVSRLFLEDGSSAYVLHICENHPVYSGHFPGHPVCPGVMTLGMVRSLASFQADCVLNWAEVKNCRFVGMMYPGDDVRCIINLMPQEDCRFAVSAEIARGDEPLLSLSAYLLLQLPNE